MESLAHSSLAQLLFLAATAMAQDDEAVAEATSEALLGTLDYVLLAAIAGAAAWWFFIREGENDQIPDCEIKPMAVPAASESGGSGAEKGFLAKMKKTKRRMVVFYGSQTGTAEEFAGRLAKEGARYGLKGLVADPEEENMEDLQQLTDLDSELGPCLAVFMLATYGEGDPTDNAVDFNEKLTNDGMELSGMKYAVFGLGNKTYEHFNKMGKFVDAKLEELGAKRIYTLGVGDDDD